MVLFDDIVPPLEDNVYRVTVETDVSINGAPAPVDPSLVEREVSEALAARLGATGADLARRGGGLARRAFEAHIEVPRSVVQRDEEAVRLGRRDARAGAR